MKKLLVSFLALALIGFAPTAFAAISYIQNSQWSDNSGFGQTSGASILSNVVAGHLIIISYVGNSGGVTVTSTDSNGVVLFAGSTTWNGTSPAYTWYVKNTSAGTHTITVNMSSGDTFPAMYATEYSGADTSAPFDVFNASTSGSGTTIKSGNMTSAIANEMIYGSGNFSGSSVNAAGTGFTIRLAGGEQNGNRMEDNATSSLPMGTATSAIMTGLTSNPWEMMGSMWKPAAAATSSAVARRRLPLIIAAQ